MKMLLRPAQWSGLWFSAAMMVLAACSDGNDSGPPSYVGETTTALVTAAAGGKINLGAVSVEIPQGAVDTDRSITLTVTSKKGRPREKDVAIDVYEFTDTEFMAPVKMNFELKGVPLKGKKAEIVFLEKDAQTNTDKWTALADSKVEGGKISATTTHFSAFSVLLSPANDGGDSGDGWGQACNTGYQACGGDLTGTWNLETGCSAFVDLPFGENGLLPFPCAEPGHYEGSTTVSGSITFHPDGTYTQNTTTTIRQLYVVPVSCLNEISELVGEPYTCELLSGTIEGNNCVSIVSDDEPYEEIADGRYLVEGDKLSMTTIDPSLIEEGYYGGDSGVDPYTHGTFCVAGDTLRVRYDTAASSFSALLTEFSAARGTTPMETVEPASSDADGL